MTNPEYELQDPAPLIPHHTAGTGFIGEAVLEKSFNTHDPDLYEVVGLDPDKWRIVGIHAMPANAYHSDSSVAIYAIDKSRLDEGQNRPGGTVGAKSADVVQFHTGLTFEDIHSAMKSSSIFYKSHGLRDAEFKVVGRGDLSR